MCEALQGEALPRSFDDFWESFFFYEHWPSLGGKIRDDRTDELQPFMQEALATI